MFLHNPYDRWAGEPALAEGRVFLFAGEVHLVPVCSGPGDVSPFPVGRPDPAVAARFVANYPHLTCASAPVQKVRETRRGETVGVFKVPKYYLSSYPFTRRGVKSSPTRHGAVHG